MKLEKIILDYQKRAERLGLSVYRLLKEAKISSGNFYQWRKGNLNPTIGHLEQINVVLEKHEQNNN